MNTLRIISPERVARYSFDKEVIPGRDDLDTDVNRVDPGFAEVDPRDFIRPDGSYDVTPLNVDPEAAELVRQWRDRLREVSPQPIAKVQEWEDDECSLT